MQVTNVVVESIWARPWLVVSNNRRNLNLDTFLAVRITTTTSRFAGMPTVVSLGPHDPVAGFAMCDDLWLLYRDEIIEPAGALATATMKAVNDALRAALAIP